MKKLILSACLVAGTSVGAGMLALPMVLCKIGILPTLGLILVLWFFMYLSGLFGIELNLRAKKGLTLGQLGCIYSGPGAAHLGSISLVFLIYALLCAYLYGGASIFQSFLESHFAWSLPLRGILLTYGLVLALVLTLSVQRILQINKALLILLLASFAMLSVALFQKVEFSDLPLVAETTWQVDSWTLILPVLLTSFGFQVIFHTLTDFCNKDALLLKRAIFWGSLIPAVVYIIWTLSTLGVLYHYAPEKYALLALGKLDVGQFVEALSETGAWPWVKSLVSVMTILAILKSSIGVGLGLLGFWKEKLGSASYSAKAASLGLTMVPPLLISLFVSELFLKAMSFAGMVLVLIAIALPLWLINCPKAKRETAFYPMTESKILQGLFFLLGVFIVVSELTHMIK